MFVIRKAFMVFYLAAGLCLEAAAATSPWDKFELTPLIQQNYTPEKSTDEGGLWMSSDDVEEATKQSPFLVKDRLINLKVKEMVCQIAGDYCGDIRVYILRNPQFNATMFPNGMMHIWTGLLLRVENEAQLAAVIGHEIGHYLRNHSLTRWKSIKSQTGAAAWVSLISMGAGVGFVGDIFSLGVLASIMAYSREHESEADAYGLKLLADAGYDPNQASLVWAYVERENENAKNPRQGSIFTDSHPSPENRKEVLESLADSLPASSTPYKVGAKEYNHLLEEYYPELISAELSKQLPGRTETLLEHLAQRNIGTLPINYYWGIFYKNRQEEGDVELAKSYFRKAIEDNNSPAEVYRDLGYILLKEKDLSSAKTLFNNYLERSPNASDKEMIEFYLNMSD